MMSFKKIIRSLQLTGLEPVSREFGYDRGQPIDRYFIENFLDRRRQDIRGRVLEIGDPGYTRKFGSEKVTQSDVLHSESGHSHVTIVGDLATGKGLADQCFDCMILTQTLPFIYDIHGVVANTYAKLRCGGVLLATLPGISQVSRYDMDRWGDFWRFTDASARRLFGDVFGDDNVTVEIWGNVFVASAFLYGLASRELSQSELDYVDADYQVLITVRAVKKIECDSSL